MGYYEDAMEWEGTAIDLYACGRYRGAVYMACLAVECLLKSKVEVIDPYNKKLSEHDSIYLFRLINSKYPTNKDLMTGIKLCRKYHSDVRYSNTHSEAYDSEFAKRFIKIVSDLKAYINNECAVTIEDLAEKYEK